MNRPIVGNAGVRGLLERKIADPRYRARFERRYPEFVLEVQILKALERKRWNLTDLARALHTSKGNVSRDLSAGGIRSASLPRLRRVAQALGMEFIPLLVERKRGASILTTAGRFQLEDLVKGVTRRNRPPLLLEDRPRGREVW